MNDSSFSRVTLQDIANHLGISKTTVCRALQNHPNVSPATSKKILTAAKKMGYRSDPALSALAKHRWGNSEAGAGKYGIALVTIHNGSNPRLGVRGDRKGLFDAYKQRGEQLNIITDTFELGPKDDPQVLGRILDSRGFDGVIFNISRPMTDWDFPFEKFSLITVGYDHPEHHIHSITSGWAKAVELAAERCQAVGRTRIGFAPFLHGHPRMDRVIIGAMLACRRELEREVGPQPALFEFSNEQLRGEGPHPDFQAWIEEEKPDVVVDGNSILYWWLRDVGLKIPDDIGYCSLLHPEVDDVHHYSGVMQRYDIQGAMAMERLIQLVQLNVRGFVKHPVVTLVQPDWSDQGSL